MSRPGIRLLGLLMIVASVGGPGTASECDQPTSLEITSATISGDSLEASVGNPTSTSLQGFLYGTIQAGGRRIEFYGPVTVGAHSTETFVIRFAGSITVLEELGTCGSEPTGVSDSPDPIVVVPQEKDA